MHFCLESSSKSEIVYQVFPCTGVQFEITGLAIAKQFEIFVTVLKLFTPVVVLCIHVCVVHVSVQRYWQYWATPLADLSAEWLQKGKTLMH